MSYPSDRLLPDAWHLRTRGSARPDLDVAPVWDPAAGAAYTGAGTRTVVIDDGFDYRHPDLAPNWNAALGHDYRTGGDDPFGVRADAHGTAVAGLIGAAADGAGTVGVAFETELVGYRTAAIIGNAWLEDIRDAIRDAALVARADVVNISQGIANDPDSTFGVGYARERFAEIADSIGAAVDAGRGGLGTVIVKAAGNSREAGYDVNADPWTHDSRQVVVGAVDRGGAVSYYSSYGAALLVSAFGTDGKVLTTDRTGKAGYEIGNYTHGFNGTSAATPMVSGIVALMFEANPDLGWRDVQSILAASARHVGSAVGAGPSGAEHSGWAWNGADAWNGGGQHFSNDYGYGLVDARAAVRMAETWLTTGAAAATSANEVTLAADLLDVETAIPDGEADGLRFTGTIDGDAVAERVTVELALATSYIGDLRVTLISPSGTESELVRNVSAREAIDGRWTFDSQAFRGEDARGAWTVQVADSFSYDTLSVSDIVVRVGGTASADDRYLFTDAYSDVAGEGGHRRSIDDADGGRDTVNAAAVSSDSRIRLGGEAGSIDGVSVRFAGIENAIGGDGDDQIAGARGGNRLYGIRGDDSIRGGGGADTLSGGAGDDRLFGGSGADILIGGAGQDRFRFRSASDTPATEGGHDVLLGIGGAAAFGRPGGKAGDLFVLSAIDANERRSGDQAFRLDDSGKAGTLGLVDNGTVTTILGHVDADRVADFRIDIVDGPRVAAADYGAADFIL